MFDTFVNMQRSEHTKSAYRKDIAKWESFLAGRVPTESLALEWRDQLVAKLSGASALRTFTVVRSYYRWVGGPNPFERLKAPRRTSNWTPVSPPDSDVDRLLGVCTDPRDRAIITLLANGLRAQEVCDLKSDDFFYVDHYQVWVLRVTGKGDKQRLVPPNSETVTALHNYTFGREKMFSGLTPRKVHYVVEKWAKSAGISGLHPHALRHSFATRLIRAHVDVFSVQRLLGHARSETTSLYVNLEFSDLINAANADPRNITDSRSLEVVA